MNLKKSDQFKLVVISGPSGVGKSGVIKILLDRTLGRSFCFHFCTSVTTREPRDGEVNNVDYHFTTKDYFKELVKNKEFLEHEENYGNYYGTLRREVVIARTAGEIPLLDIDVKGHRRLRKNPELNGKILSIFLQPPNMKVLEERLLKREGEKNKEKTHGRLSQAPEEMRSRREYDIIITNHTVLYTAEQITRMVTGRLFKGPLLIH